MYLIYYDTKFAGKDFHYRRSLQTPRKYTLSRCLLGFGFAACGSLKIAYPKIRKLSRKPLGCFLKWMKLNQCKLGWTLCPGQRPFLAFSLKVLVKILNEEITFSPQIRHMIGFQALMVLSTALWCVLLVFIPVCHFRWKFSIFIYITKFFAKFRSMLSTFSQVSFIETLIRNI